MKLLFVYGTLKRGGVNHAQMRGQKFVAEARTVAGYRLFDLGDFPGMVPVAEDRDGVAGEIWEVSAAGLKRLDLFEGVSGGLYRREGVMLAGEQAGAKVETYIYARGVEGKRDAGGSWGKG